jgi:RNA polymerase sigma-70 factor (ECF subfamily)
MSDDKSNFTETELIACVPHLRAFALSLARKADRADDLVQDTIVRALAAAHQFQVGTNLKGWMFTILRNVYYTDLRKNRRQILSLSEPLAYEPAVPPTQMASLEFGDFRRAFWQLPDDQREVLILVGASGLSYEEAATVCDCRIGTIKSRVSRARAQLLRILEDGLPADKRQDWPTPADYIRGPLDGRRTWSPSPS